MDRRLELHEELCSILNMVEPDGDTHVYFQPGPSVQLKYPAIVYSLNDIDTKSANNGSYMQSPNFLVTLIDGNPDSKYLDKISSLPQCRFSRFYASDNLNHWAFIKY